MKKILLLTSAFLLSVSLVFAERETGVELGDIFGPNQLGAGYDSAEWDTSMYIDFGTEKLRFSVNVLDLGGSWFNNSDLKPNSSVPFGQGMPQFFVGAGYKVNDVFRFAIGYGGKLAQYNDAGDNKAGYWGNDVSLYLQANAGANVIKLGIPVYFGAGFGKKVTQDSISGDDIETKYKDTTSFGMAPEIRWTGNAGPLVQIRFKVPFASAKRKGVPDAQLETSFDKYEAFTIGADLRVYLRFATDPVQVQFVPRVRYNIATKGNNSAVNAMADPATYLGQQTKDLGNNPFEYRFSFGRLEGYRVERPWGLRVDLPIDLTVSTDLITAWAAPQVGFYAAGGSKITSSAAAATSVIVRHTAFYGVAYGLPLELTIKPIPNFDVNIGMEAGGTSPLNGGSKEAYATVDGSVVWYF